MMIGGVELADDCRPPRRRRYSFLAGQSTRAPLASPGKQRCNQQQTVAGLRSLKALRLAGVMKRSQQLRTSPRTRDLTCRETDRRERTFLQVGMLSASTRSPVRPVVYSRRTTAM